MIVIRNLLIIAVSLAAVAGCAKPAAPAVDAAADAEAVRAVNHAWFAAYKAADADALAALYAEDAVLLAPGAAAVSGRAAIREFYAKDTAASASAGLSNVEGATSDVGISGDGAFQSGAFTVADASGATVDTGKYLTVFKRQDGKWMIIRDTWNSDAAPAASATPVAPASAEAPKS
jgi:uncharacterized protein (TIGR02246 family)